MRTLLLLGLGVCLLTQVAAESLPNPQAAFASVTTKDAIYLFGGDQGAETATSSIVKWTGTGDATNVGSLPAARWAQTAVWTGQKAYIFGGTDSATGKATRDVVSFTPGSTATLLSARLPTARDWMSSVWDARITTSCPSGCAYLFGGGTTSGATADILRFEPVAGTFTTMNAKLPLGRWGTSAVWDGTTAYIVGGLNGLVGFSDILSYDPIADKMNLAATMVLPVADPAVAWKDGALFIVGGHTTDERFGRPTVLKWTPGQPVVTSCLPLEHPVFKAGLFPVKNGLKVVGGYEDLAGRDGISTRAIRTAPYQSCLDLLPDGLPAINPVAIVNEVLRNVDETIDVSDDVTVTLSGGSSTSLVSTVVQSSETRTMPGLPAASKPLPYAQVSSEVDGKLDGIRVDLDVQGNADPNSVSLYYRDGSEWIDLTGVQPGTTVGTNEPVKVIETGKTGTTLWAVLDHGSLVAVAPKGAVGTAGSAISAADGDAPSESSPGAGALLLLALVAVAAIGRRRQA